MEETLLLSNGLKATFFSKPTGAIQVVKLVSELSNLISDANLFCIHQQKQYGIMEPPIFLSIEATFGWYDEQMMMSTVALHGFVFMPSIKLMWDPNWIMRTGWI